MQLDGECVVDHERRDQWWCRLKWFDGESAERNGAINNTSWRFGVLDFVWLLSLEWRLQRLLRPCYYWNHPTNLSLN